jgi:hypothetical protein
VSRFRFADAAFEVQAPVEDDLRWLAAYLGPDFAPASWVQEPRRTIRIVLIHDAEAHGALTDRAETVPEQVPLVALALNQRDHLAHQVVGSDGRSWLHVPTWNAFVHQDGPDIVVLGKGDGDAARAMLMRIVREWAVDRVLHTGGTVVHACALAASPGVVIVAGTEGAGKTSTLLTLLAQDCAGYVANDRIAVWREGAGAVGRGLPTLVGIRDGTFDLLSRIGPLGERVVDRIHRAARTGHPDARLTSSGKVKLTPVDIDPVFGAGTAQPGGPVLGIVLPSVAALPADDVMIRPVSPEEWTPDRLLALECRRGFARDIGEVFVTEASDEAASRLRASSLAVKQALVSVVPAVTVTLRPGVPLSPSDWERIVEALVQHRPPSGR